MKRSKTLIPLVKKKRTVQVNSVRIKMLESEAIALQTAIAKYIELAILDRVCSNLDSFLASVPMQISKQRLRSLVLKHGAEIAKYANAQSVEYIPGSYKPSNRGKFGRQKGGDRAQRIAPSIKFIYEKT
jgi:hypothetical protein